MVVSRLWIGLRIATELDRKIRTRIKEGKILSNIMLMSQTVNRQRFTHITYCNIRKTVESKTSWVNHSRVQRGNPCETRFNSFWLFIRQAITDIYLVTWGYLSRDTYGTWSFRFVRYSTVFSDSQKRTIGIQLISVDIQHILMGLRTTALDSRKITIDEKLFR